MNIDLLPRVVLLPYPLTPFSAFIYFLLTKVMGDHFPKFVRKSAGKIATDSKVVINLSLPVVDLIEAEKLIDKSSLPSHWLRRTRNFCLSPTEDVRPIFDSLADWLKELSEVEKTNMGAIAPLLDKFFLPLAKKKADIRRLKSLKLPKLRQKRKIKDNQLGNRVVFLPILKQKGGIAGSTFKLYVKTAKILVREANALKLITNNTHLLIVGEPGVGKSFLAASLHSVMYGLIEEILSRRGKWNVFKWLRISLESLDFSTPVTEFIGKLGRDDRPIAHNRPALDSIKRHWTEISNDEVLEVLRDLFVGDSLVISDLPGKISEITEYLAAATGNASIVLWRTEDERDRWTEFMSSVGCPVVAKVKIAQDGFSMLTTLSDDRVHGRLHQPDRRLRDFDSMIQSIASILLFKILPHICLK